MRHLLLPAAFLAGALLLRRVLKDPGRPSPARASRTAGAWSAAAGLGVLLAWLAPVPLSSLLGNASLTYGNPKFDPTFLPALPAVAALLFAAFAGGVEPSLRDGRGAAERRATITVVALLVLAGLRGRPGQGGGTQWLLLLWEVFCLRLAALALVRLTGSLLGGAVLLAGFAFVRLYALSRVDGAYETYGHYVASPALHLVTQAAWPGAVAAVLLLAARRAPPRGIVGTW